MKATLWLDGERIGHMFGPADRLVPWLLMWDAPHGEHPIAVYAHEDADPGVAGIVTVLWLSEGDDGQQN